ncbi:hypothetical protein GCM10010501_26190 [Streptomyces libani subsp. rufus]|nr:hypothetical protein GCM10010501_26190 [Streptomyces libani subsp. rufus]
MSSTQPDSDIDKDEGAFFDENAEPFLDKPIKLEPGQGIALSVGLYRRDEPKPRFKVTTKPNIGKDLGSSFDEIPHSNDQKYLTFCMLLNYNSKPCTVTIHRADSVAGRP